MTVSPVQSSRAQARRGLFCDAARYCDICTSRSSGPSRGPGQTRSPGRFASTVSLSKHLDLCLVLAPTSLPRRGAVSYLAVWLSAGDLQAFLRRLQGFPQIPLRRCPFRATLVAYARVNQAGAVRSQALQEARRQCGADRFVLSLLIAIAFERRSLDPMSLQLRHARRAEGSIFCYRCFYRQIDA